MFEIRWPPPKAAIGVGLHTDVVVVSGGPTEVVVRLPLFSLKFCSLKEQLLSSEFEDELDEIVY